MSGSASDTLEWQPHIRSKARREELAKAFKNPKKPFRIVIMREGEAILWLNMPLLAELEINILIGFLHRLRSLTELMGRGARQSICEMMGRADGTDGDGDESPEELELAVRQIVSRAISSDKVIDIFDAAGLKKPDISVLADEFLAGAKHLPQRNLAVELLQKLLNNELKVRQKKCLVQSHSFAEMLEVTFANSRRTSRRRPRKRCWNRRSCCAGIGRFEGEFLTTKNTEITEEGGISDSRLPGGVAMLIGN